jgi:hypothetical protein
MRGPFSADHNLRTLTFLRRPHGARLKRVLGIDFFQMEIVMNKATGTATAAASAGPAAGAVFTLRHGKRYRATIVLHGLEQFASDAMLKQKFESYGFSDVGVTGVGGTRIAEGTWNGGTVTGAIDSHIVKVEEENNGVFA